MYLQPTLAFRHFGNTISVMYIKVLSIWKCRIIEVFYINAIVKSGSGICLDILEQTVTVNTQLPQCRNRVIGNWCSSQMPTDTIMWTTASTKWKYCVIYSWLSAWATQKWPWIQKLNDIMTNEMDSDHTSMILYECSGYHLGHISCIVMMCRTVLYC